MVFVGQPDAYTFGNAPRTISSVVQPGKVKIVMSIFKEFPIGKIREGMRRDFVWTRQRINHPNFAGPDTSLGDGSFGQITFLTKTVA